ncbi:MAG: 23S rRNA (adenine(2503)-C(2))-methyltransferase RlmN [Bacteroidaceae bacterium]|nr:23S rRNA (adenine(2503)-C(2))-methyltransferase RlmN [Bacteroidaceae bacterium]
MQDKVALLGMTLSQLQSIVADEGLPKFTAKQLAQWIYQKGVDDIMLMTNLSMTAREKLAVKYEVGISHPLHSQQSTDGTIKYLFPVRGGGTVETVFIPEEDRATACVSVQVGCKMGCKFCMTGRQGFHGQLTVTDILNQLYAMPESKQLTNLVVMGQGEPMDNLDAVLTATELLQADYGWAWSPRRITVSTVGLRKGLQRFLDESQCHLAVSMHNPFSTERAEWMPAEKAMPIEEIVEIIKTYDWSGQRRVSFEYIVFHGLNDGPRYIRKLTSMLRGLECRINLIKWHSLPEDTSGFRTTTDEQMQAMRDSLTNRGIRCTIRASRGQDIDAACGLLNTQDKQQVNG